MHLIDGLPTAIGPYRLLRTLGKGGIGQVFAAVDEREGRHVALKVLSAESAEDPQISARFLQEGRALEQLRHPGIVKVYGCGKFENGTAYLAMEHLEGDTLEAWMRTLGAPASLDVALAITRQIADAMVAVHEKGIVHRDLKPANIILSPDDGAPLGWRPTVVDFGIAKVPPPGRDLQSATRGDTHIKTAEHSVLGTSAYMAPEQCNDAPNVTTQADVYGLGLILFELLAGQPPFTSTDEVELLLDHVNTAPPQVRELAPTVPPLLDTFVASMLAKAPGERPTMSRCRDMLARPWRSETTECPFPGLQPFSEAQAELFFGREAEARELLALLEGMRKDDSRRWLQIEGLSGAGKSSLVQAGILPELAGQPWLLAVLRPSDDPIRALARALTTAYAEHGLTRAPPDVESAMRSDPDSLLTLVEQHNLPSMTLLLVIEQLEELFALGGPHIEQLDALLSRALTNPGTPLRLLTTLRNDYIHRLEQTPEIARLLNSRATRYQLHPMREDALAHVIRGMASRAGLRLSPDLAERMVREAASAEGRLPLLGHALRSLWSTRSGSELTHEQYERMGGVSGALARQITQFIADLGEEGRERAKWLVLDLVQVGRGAPDTRRPRTRGELLAAAGGDTKAEEVLARLSAMPLSSSPGAASEPLRLVVISGDGEDPARQRVDLVHEALLQRVPVIVAWIDDERALLERHADLEGLADTWERAGCPVDGLPSGSLLAHYQGHTRDLRRHERLVRMASDRARRFLDAAVQLDRRRLLLRRAFVGALLIAVVAISITALFARRERGRAEESLETFISTTNEIVSNADWALGRLPYTVEVRRAMLDRIEKDLSTLQHRDQPKVRRALIRAKHRRSDLARQNETLAGARELIDQARALINAEQKDHPSDPEVRMLLALNLSKRGKIALARGHHDNALADFTSSVTLLASMSSEDEADDRRMLATSYSEQADTEVELGRFSVAEGLYGKATPLLDQNGDTESGYDRALLASTLTLQADAARSKGDPGAAARHLDRAQAIQEKLAQKHPENMLYQLYLGGIYASLAALRSEQGQTPEAARLYGRAIDIGEVLHQADRTQKEYGLLLCRSLQGAEVTAGAQGDTRQNQERRCEVARLFGEQDVDDRRFSRFACR